MEKLLINRPPLILIWKSTYNLHRKRKESAGTVSLLLGDHLGSTSVVAQTNGALVATRRYDAWGGLRYSSGTTPTKYRFTGQREESPIRLYWYNSRFYDSELGRFAQADSIVPVVQGVQAWDRYACTMNNPLRFMDPDGHIAVTNDGEDQCKIAGCGTKNTLYSENNARVASKIAFFFDAIGMAVSKGEQWAANAMYASAAISFIGGPEIGVPTLTAAITADSMIATVLSPVEDGASYLGLVATALSDLSLNQTTITRGELYLGRDTIVATRNSAIGIIRQSNIDAWASESQIRYDLARNNGIEPWGSLKIDFSAKSVKELGSQVFWDNSFWQEGITWILGSLNW